MRARQIHYRLRDAEYRALAIEAEKAGIAPSALARLLALQSLDLSGRLAAIEQGIRALPDRAAMTEAFNRIAARLPMPRTAAAGQAAP